MPGIFAIITNGSRSNLEHRMKNGTTRLLRCGDHQVKTFMDRSVGISSVQRKGLLPGGDLWVSDDKRIIIAVDGEIYCAPEADHTDGKRFSIKTPTAACAEHIGALYEKDGDGWVEQVRGAFSVLIFDRRENRLLLYSDRFGFRPLCYGQIGQTFVVGSTMSTFTGAFPDVSWGLNWDAVADWFTFQHVLGEKTFLANVHLVPNASCICYRSDANLLSSKTYWTLENLPLLSKIHFNEAVKEACRLFRMAIKEQAQGEGRIGVYLTSGLDSRTIAGFLSPRYPFVSATYGTSGCRDMVWGKALATIVGSRHRAFPMDDGNWISRYGERFLAASESFVSCFNAHGISTYADMAEEIDVHLSGVGGGSFAGGDTASADALYAATDLQRAEAMYQHYVGALGNVFTTAMERMRLYHPKIREQMRDRAEASFVKEFKRYENVDLERINDAFALNNRYKKMFAHMMVAERDSFENRLPFMDYRFMDFILSLPASIRLHRRLQIGMLDHALPHLTHVPWQVTATLPTQYKIKRLLHRHTSRVRYSVARRLGIGSREPFEPGRNYPLWLRESCMPWARNIIDSDSVGDRGVLNREYLQDLLSRVERSRFLGYERQRNLTYRIGAVLSFEWMCRQLFDGLEVG